MFPDKRSQFSSSSIFHDQNDVLLMEEGEMEFHNVRVVQKPHRPALSEDLLHLVSLKLVSDSHELNRYFFTSSPVHAVIHCAEPALSNFPDLLVPRQNLRVIEAFTIRRIVKFFGLFDKGKVIIIKLHSVGLEQFGLWSSSHFKFVTDEIKEGGEAIKVLWEGDLVSHLGISVQVDYDKLSAQLWR